MIKERIDGLKFSPGELGLLFSTAVVTALVLSFRMWGEGEKFDFNMGIESFIIMLVVSFVSLFVHFLGEKFYGIRKGMKTVYEVNLIGLLVSVVSVVLFNGWLFILAPGWSYIEAVKKQRIGKWRYRPYFREYGFLAMNGVFASLALAGVASLFSGNIAGLFVRANLLIAFFSLVPAPMYDGFHIFFGSFYQYAFILCFAVVFSFFLFLFNFWSAVVAGVIVGCAGFFFVMEKMKKMKK